MSDNMDLPDDNSGIFIDPRKEPLSPEDIIRLSEMRSNFKILMDNLIIENKISPKQGNVILAGIHEIIFPPKAKTGKQPTYIVNDESAVMEGNTSSKNWISKMDEIMKSIKRMEAEHPTIINPPKEYDQTKPPEWHKKG